MILEGLMTDLGWILFAVALIFGFLGGSALIYFLPIMQKRRAENNAKKIISQAENKADRIVKNAQLDSKQTINELKQEAEKNIKERKQEIAQQENKLFSKDRFCGKNVLYLVLFMQCFYYN